MHPIDCFQLVRYTRTIFAAAGRNNNIKTTITSPKFVAEFAQFLFTHLPIDPRFLNFCVAACPANSFVIKKNSWALVGNYAPFTEFYFSRQNWQLLI
jgi:hypothetical protein